jgi:hypothetical protein
MFTLDEVIIIVLIFGAIIGFIAYQYAQYRMIARMLASLSDEEIGRLESLKEQLEAALTDEEADGIIANANGVASVTLTQEVVAGTLYLYNGNTFVAQGNTAAEAAANFFNSSHSHSKATVRCGEGKEYLIIDGKIENGYLQ